MTVLDHVFYRGGSATTNLNGVHFAFTSALSALNLSDHPEHVLFIDNHQNNLDAAAACGMHTLLAVRQATQAQTEQMIIMGITDKLLSLGIVL